MESLVKKLDEAHPDKPKCETIAIRDYVDNVLSAPVEEGPYKGMTYIEAAVLAKLKYGIAHPESNAISLGDISKVSAPRKDDKNQDDPSKKVLELYVRFDEPAQEVVDPEDGYK